MHKNRIFATSVKTINLPSTIAQVILKKTFCFEDKVTELCGTYHLPAVKQTICHKFPGSYGDCCVSLEIVKMTKNFTGNKLFYIKMTKAFNLLEDV